MVNKHEFKFVVTGVELDESQIQRVSTAIAQAAVLALGESATPEAVTVPLGRTIWWRGIPADPLREELVDYAEQQVRSAAGPAVGM
jgi:hypothetical protein